MGKVGEQLLDEVEVPTDGSQDLMRTEQPVRGAELWERAGEVIGNLAGMRHRNDGRSLQRCFVEGGSGGESTKHLQDGTSLHFISPQLPHEHVHRLRQRAVHCHSVVPPAQSPATVRAASAGSGTQSSTRPSSSAVILNTWQSRSR